MSPEFGLCLPATGIPNCAAAAKDEFPLPRPVRHQPVSGVRVLIGRVRAALNGRPRDNGELIPLSGGDFVVGGVHAGVAVSPAVANQPPPLADFVPVPVHLAHPERCHIAQDFELQANFLVVGGGVVRGRERDGAGDEGVSDFFEHDDYPSRFSVFNFRFRGFRSSQQPRTPPDAPATDKHPNTAPGPPLANSSARVRAVLFSSE